ncbi:hypothetical protein CR513_53471, partial [Mucuna pruriens]
MIVRERADLTPPPMISFDERDMRYKPPRHDEPMVISIEVAEYKVERVLIDQGSSTNILYWSTYKKLGLQPTDMEPCVGKLYGFTGEQVEIRGGIELETTFGERSYARTIPVLYTIVDVEASYKVILGRPTLNKLGAVISTYHLCMKYPVGKEVRRVWADHRVVRRYYEDSLRIDSRLAQANMSNVNVLDLDLDLVSQKLYTYLGPKKDRPAKTLRFNIGGPNQDVLISARQSHAAQQLNKGAAQ